MCNACGLCAKTCAFGAIEYFDKTQPPNVIKALCKGCGTCAAECPTDAINIIHYTNEQILAQVDAALAENPDKKIIVITGDGNFLMGLGSSTTAAFYKPKNLLLDTLIPYI